VRSARGSILTDSKYQKTDISRSVWGEVIAFQCGNIGPIKRSRWVN
jgi:hypothetical protein